VSEATGTAVDGRYDLPYLVEPQRAGSDLVIDMIYDLYLTKMIARTQAPKLRDPALDRLTGNGIRISSRQAATLFSRIQVLRQTITFFDGPGRATHHYVAHLTVREFAHSIGAHARGQVME
jgi:hypothetical protein